MDLPVLRQICKELDPVLTGGFVNKIHQPLPREILLRIRARGTGELKLALSADPLMGRIHLTDFRPPNPPAPPRFCAYLRAHVQGARILGVSCQEKDRVVKLHVVRGRDESAREMDLILELLGRDSNILVVDSSTGLILDCLHRIPPRETTSRVVTPGSLYSPPPARAARGPLPEESARPEMEIRPGITAVPSGRLKLTARANPETDRIFDTFNEAADELYAGGTRELLFERYARELAAPVKARIRALNKRLTKIEKDRKRLAGFLERQGDGELIKGNLGRIKKGMKEIRLQDWESEEERIVTLNPALTPVANMEAIFRKAAKGKRGRDVVERRYEETLQEINALEDLLYFIEEASDIDRLEFLASERTTFGLPRQSDKANAGKTKRFEREVHDRYLSVSGPGGSTVLIGRSAKGNDYLLRNMAHKEDLWFHVSGMPGSHVILKVDGEPSAEEIQFAADSAARYSRARGKGKVEVMMANIKDVSRIKGASLGQVKVKRHKTIVGYSLDD